MQSSIQLKRTTLLFFIPLALACFALLPQIQAVSPTPDGGYPNFTTAEGQNALKSLTSGVGNTGVGWLSLESVTSGQFNTAIGAGTLALNSADQNTATGAGALLSNTTGGINTADGAFALFKNITGGENTATGNSALFNNTTGGDNTAVGVSALINNSTGGDNTAVGAAALSSNPTANNNTAIGAFALLSTTGGANTACGNSALMGATTGHGNVALGNNAGSSVTTASNVICIGTDGANVDGSCYIGSIHGKSVDPATGLFAYVDSSGKLGTVLCARRFKHDIKPMDKDSEAILALKPVTFHYKNDAANTQCFGLVAEEVAAINPDLIVRNKNGEILTVRYDAVNAMLLNEFLKEHRKVQELGATVAKQEAIIAKQQKDFEASAACQQKQIEALTAGLQKVSAQLELNKPAPQTVLNNH